MAKYFTQGWCNLYMEEINKSAAYEEAAKTWEGDVYFVSEAGGPVDSDAYMYVDLWHGKCRKCEIITDPSKYKPAYTFAATHSVWKKIATRQLDVTKAVIEGQAKIKGDMARVLRYTKAASELTNCTMRVPTDWLD